MDPILLARAQFAANISFHTLFPAITIAPGWLLMFFRWRWRRTQDGAWLAAYRFWTKVFALTFALGVVSGVTMSFQFGTNWPGFMERAGNVAGPLLGYEVLTAFLMMVIPATTTVVLLVLRRVLPTRLVRDELCWLPFVLLLAVFALGFVGLAYSIYPYVVIDRLTIWQAASSPATLKVTLVGVCISVPAIVAYTIYSYRVFGGKATELHYG
jgi:cytochrome bd-type quinol oxidase subunit 2